MIKILSLLIAVALLSGCGSSKTEEVPVPIPESEQTGDTLPDPTIQTLPSAPNEESKTFTLNEVATHNTQNDCWTVINGTVADITSFFGKHPAGDDKLALACGKDASQMFTSVKKHDPNGYIQLQSLSIGKLTQ